jgi:hypothetical protein
MGNTKGRSLDALGAELVNSSMRAGPGRYRRSVAGSFLMHGSLFPVILHKVQSLVVLA